MKIIIMSQYGGVLSIAANVKVHTIVHPERCMSLCTLLNAVTNVTKTLNNELF